VKNIICFGKSFVQGWKKIGLLYFHVLFFLGDDGLKVEGIEVGMVSLVGKILSVEHGETKSTIVIEDHTGSIEAVQWHDENSESAQDQEANGIIEGADVRILGSVRTQQEKRYLMVSRR
jgi:hypothetical protein